ncbi:DUF234 domain-containing protein [Sulfurimonas sp.]|uniref:DUF234 domain-containing protein n=1 Tax=Sulfurimonas sp. TaxID=2022749 RepID=UPI0026262A77|nr:DUF234 domain-containing protein [Sulfurimonas sp.]
MTNNRLLKQFRSFYFKNYPDDMETQISYFSVFGGLNWQIDTTQEISLLIKSLILDNFAILNEKIDEITLKNDANKRLLKALATGDRRIFSAFNRAGLNNGNGGAALHYLQEKGIIELEYSREEHPRKLYPNKKLKKEEARYRISHKVLFTHPFIRFWFYFIQPNIKSIAAGDYEKVLQEFTLKRSSYTSLIYEELSEVLLNYHLRDADIVSSGSYWDAKTEIDILTLTKDEKFYIGECKWTNHKVNKKEFHKLGDKCKKLGIVPTQIILFSKRGFSKELEQMQGAKLALYTSDDFMSLLKKSSVLTNNSQSFISFL